MKITKQQIRQIVEEEIKNILLEDDEPKKDACYRKIKAAVKKKGGTWPSAYASGRLVQCRDKGAANWKEGETKKENIVYNRLRQMVEQEISNLNEKKKKKNTLGDWFDQQGPPGPEGGWVDCNTCRKDKKTGRKKCKKCGRDTGEKRAKYPKCRPTPSACSKPGNYGKKSKAGKKG